MSRKKQFTRSALSALTVAIFLTASSAFASEQAEKTIAYPATYDTSLAGA